MASSLTSVVQCFHCKSPLEDSDCYQCRCEESNASENLHEPIRYYCNICILPHTKSNHVVKDRKGNEIATCKVHSILPSFYCCNEKRLVCMICPCQRLNHSYLNIKDEALKCRKHVFEFLGQLEKKEKALKFRKNTTDDLLSDHLKQTKKFQKFVHDTMMAIEQQIIENRNKGDSSKEEKIQQTKTETESCIDKTLYFQEKLRTFLALSDGALVEKFVEDEDQVVSLIKEQDRLTNLVSFSESCFEEFDTASFVQQTADNFLSKIQLPCLQEAVSNDLTVEENVEIENLNEIENKTRTNVQIDSSFGKFGWLINKQANAEVYVSELMTANHLSNSGKSNTVAVSNSKVGIKNIISHFISTNVSSTLKNAHWINEWIILVFENGWYCVYDTETKMLVKNAEIGYTHALGPAKIHIIDKKCKRVEWAFWDEFEKVIKVSGKDSIKISCKEKPRLFEVFCHGSTDQYREFVIVNEEAEVLVINPNSAECLAVIPQNQHTLRRIDAVVLTYSPSYICLFDLNSNILIVLIKVAKMKNATKNKISASFYPYKIESVNHWRESKCAIVRFPSSFQIRKRLVATLNIGTSEMVKFKKMFFSFQ